MNGMEWKLVYLIPKNEAKLYVVNSCEEKVRSIIGKNIKINS